MVSSAFGPTTCSRRRSPPACRAFAAASSRARPPRGRAFTKTTSSPRSTARAIYDSDSLVLEVGRLPVEAVAHLGVIRNGTRQTIDVVLSKYPVRGRKVVTVRPEAWRGVRVDYASAFLEPDQPQHFGLPLTDEAVVVCEVDQNTPAAQAGMKTRHAHQSRRRPARAHAEGIPGRHRREDRRGATAAGGQRSVEHDADRSARQLAVLALELRT